MLRAVFRLLGSLLKSFGRCFEDNHTPQLPARTGGISPVAPLAQVSTSDHFLTPQLLEVLSSLSR